MVNAAQEIRFWTGIMRDHSEFMLTALSSRELESIMRAQQFKNAFISLHNDSKALEGTVNLPEIMELINKSRILLVNFINFKRIILKRLLQCNIEINLPPTFVNHMINEAMEFYSTLCKLQSKAPLNPTLENIYLHKIWLADAAGHAASIAADLDPTEALLIKEAEKFKNAFNGLFIKAFELEKMLERTCLTDGSLKGLNNEAEELINMFICYLAKIFELRKECKALGNIKPLVPDHMIREEKYYLFKIKSLEGMK